MSNSEIMNSSGVKDCSPALQRVSAPVLVLKRVLELIADQRSEWCWLIMIMEDHANKGPDLKT